MAPISKSSRVFDVDDVAGDLGGFDGFDEGVEDRYQRCWCC
jgi:hypothetical protein